MYAFLGHGSAIEALRFISARKSSEKEMRRWPAKSRPLPQANQCITAQRECVRFCQDCDLSRWGISSGPVDLLVPTRSAASRGSHARFHVWSREVPANSMIRLEDSLLASGPEMTILQLCAAQSKLEPLLEPAAQAFWAERDLFRELGIEGTPAQELPVRWERDRRLVVAAAIACEFAGTYRLPAAGDKVAYKVKPLMSCSSLKQFAEGFKRTSAESRALRVADMAFDGSASPMETALALLLTLPVEFGGFGLPRPQLNSPIDVSDRRGILADRDAVTPDMLWLDQMVAVEYDSAEKHGNAGPAQLAEDAIRSNILTVLGFRVIRVTPLVISSVPRLEMLARQIASLLGDDLQAPDEIQRKRRNKLFSELMPRRG